jgi:hypothetical protein
MEEQIGDADALITAEGEETNPEQETQEESVEEVKARLAKAEELAENYKVRAEKAEKVAKKPKETAAPTGDLTPTDLYALMNAKVAEEDISDVRDYAKLKGLSVAEALKSNVVKQILSDKAEQRTTAEASHAGAARRISTKPSPETIIENARKGNLPTDEADMDKLLDAHWELKRRK